MNKTFLVLRHEIVTTVSRKTFLIQAFGIPLLGVLIFLFLRVLGPGIPGALWGKAPRDKSSQTRGYVDHAGIVKEIPPDVPPGVLVPYPDEESAGQALKADKIDGYYIIPSDYVEKGDLFYIDPDIRPSDAGKSWEMRQTLFSSLLGQDRKLIEQAQHPMDVEVKPLAPQKESRDIHNPLVFFIPYISTLVFYMLIIISSSLLLYSMAMEKKNQVMEIMLQSVTPRQMLKGKVLGLGMVGILQALVWLGVGFILMHLSTRNASFPGIFLPSYSIILWGLVFFLLGYAVYASLIAGLGVMASNIQEASHSMIIVIWPLIVPLLFHALLIKQPSSPFSIGLSLFPLTAPIAMMTRLTCSAVPFWQPLLAALLMLLTSFTVIRAVAGMFHAGILLSGQPFSVRRYVRALLGRNPI